MKVVRSDGRRPGSREDAAAAGDVAREPAGKPVPHLPGGKFDLRSRSVPRRSCRFFLDRERAALCLQFMTPTAVRTHDHE